MRTLVTTSVLLTCHYFVCQCTICGRKSGGAQLREKKIPAKWPFFAFACALADVASSLQA